MAFSSFLSACGLEGLPSASDVENPSLGAATPETSETAIGNSTGELLPDGSILLKWPRDPSAISYLIKSNGRVIASLPAFNLSAVVKTSDNSAAGSTYTIVSVNASRIQKIWVAEPTISTDAPAVETPTVTVQPETIPVVVVPTTPIIEPEVLPVVEAPSIVEVPPIVVAPPIETVNLAPVILDTSYSCDPAIESVAFTVGQSDHFTLSVIDELPLTLTYSFDNSKDNVVSVEVDSNGVFTISALQAGYTYLWLTAKDDEGLVDEYELRVVVQ